MAQWNKAAEARNEFADMIESLSGEQLQEQSLCGEWNAHNVLAHVTTYAEISGFGLFGNILKAGFNFDKASISMAAKRSTRSTADLVASLRANATKSAPLPSFPEEMTLSDVTVHTQDIKRPLGLPASIPEERQRTVLDFLTTHKHGTTLVHRPSLEGVKLQATDIEWSFGEGAEISGPAEAIMMGLAARPVLDELTGDGVASWSATS